MPSKMQHRLARARAKKAAKKAAAKKRTQVEPGSGAKETSSSSKTMANEKALSKEMRRAINDPSHPAYIPYEPGELSDVCEDGNCNPYCRALPLECREALHVIRKAKTLYPRDKVEEFRRVCQDNRGEDFTFGNKKYPISLMNSEGQEMTFEFLPEQRIYRCECCARGFLAQGNLALIIKFRDPTPPMAPKDVEKEVILKSLALELPRRMSQCFPQAGPNICEILKAKDAAGKYCIAAGTVDKVICFALGNAFHYPPIAEQHALAVEIAKWIGVKVNGGDKPVPIYVQDPAYNDADKACLNKMGFEIVQDPDGILMVDSKSLVISIAAHACIRPAIAGLARPAAMLWDRIRPGYGGPDGESYYDICGPALYRMMEDYNELEAYQPKDIEEGYDWDWTLRFYIRKPGVELNPFD